MLTIKSTHFVDVLSHHVKYPHGELYLCNSLLHDLSQPVFVFCMSVNIN